MISGPMPSPGSTAIFILSSCRIERRLRFLGLTMGAALTHPGNGPTGKQNVDLARRQAVPHPDATFASAVMSVSEFPLLPGTTQPGVQAVKPQDRSLLEAFQVARLDELQRQDAVVHEVLAMNTRNALGQHDTGAEIAHGQSGILTARFLPVVPPPEMPR